MRNIVSMHIGVAGISAVEYSGSYYAPGPKMSDVTCYVWCMMLLNHVHYTSDAAAYTCEGIN